MQQADRLPESLDGDDVAVFLADLLTYRDRAVVLAMVLGGLRAGEVRSLRLADVDMAMGGGCEVSEAGLVALPVVEHLDVFEQVGAGLVTGRDAGQIDV